MYVKEWCRQKGINPDTYYQRLRVVREEMLEHAEIEEQKIVPVCVWEAITGNTLTEVTDKSRSDAPVSISEKIVIKKDGSDADERSETMLKELKLENIYIVCGHTDMRKSIDELAAMVQEQFHQKLFSGSLFLFCGRRHDRLKALLWNYFNTSLFF